MFLRASFHRDILTFHGHNTCRSRERHGKPGFAERLRERRASETAEHD